MIQETRHLSTYRCSAFVRRQFSYVTVFATRDTLIIVPPHLLTANCLQLASVGFQKTKLLFHNCLTPSQRDYSSLRIITYNVFLRIITYMIYRVSKPQYYHKEFISSAKAKINPDLVYCTVRNFLTKSRPRMFFTFSLNIPTRKVCWYTCIFNASCLFFGTESAFKTL